MKGNRNILVIVLAAVFILLIYLLFQFSSGKQVNWFTMYREKELQPYDLNVISKLLDDYFPEKNFAVLTKPLSQTLPLDSSQKSSYIFIGGSLFLSDDDYTRLYQFVAQGNDAFISADEIPYQLMSSIFKKEDYFGDAFWSVTDSSVRLNFTHQSLQKDGGYPYDFIYDWKKELYHWNYFSDSLLQDSTENFIALGSLDDSLLNFVKVPYGNGAFYIHTTPIIFTNYHLKRTGGLEYAQKAFSHLTTSSIYWDEFSKVPQFGNNNPGSTETPLRYILSQTSLRWAWYVLLGMVLLFLIFRAKREQRIVPVVEQNSNTSLEFIHTIGRLYYLQNDHRALALQKMRLFLAFIRSRYGIQTKTLDAAFAQKLAEKSQVSRKSIEAMLEEYKTIENMHDISVHQLTAFHGELEAFYQGCK